MSTTNIEQVSVTQREEWLAANNAIQLDVREPVEWATGTIEGAAQISMGSIPARVEELDVNTPILVICRSGGRSQQVAEFLIDQGFTAANLAGGMLEVVAQVGR